MSTPSFFNLLKSTTKFDTSRFGKDIKLFTNTTVIKYNNGTSKKLDFFNNKEGREEEKEKKKESDDDKDNDKDIEADADIEAGNENNKVENRDLTCDQLRKKYAIHIQGSDVIDPISNFNDLLNEPYNIPNYLSENINLIYKLPTPIQMQAIPRRDVIAIAPTGSGKTAAYLIPLLALLRHPTKVAGIRSLILLPTRELAGQLNIEANIFAKGRPFKIVQLEKTKVTNKIDILIGTPMRVVHAIDNKYIDLTLLEFLILDEADRLMDVNERSVKKDNKVDLNEDDKDTQPENNDDSNQNKNGSSFAEQVDLIFASCPPNTTRAFFSATMPPVIEQLARSILTNPIRISIGVANAAATTIKQELVFVGREDGKLIAIRNLLKAGITPPILIFVQSIERARQLFHELVYDGIRVEVLHAQRTDLQRDQIVQEFRRGNLWVLITTDLLGRGVDFKAVNCVINYDFPQNSVSYIHRIGRTGRAGREGRAITLFTEDDSHYLRSIANVMKLSGCPVAEWMLNLKKPTGSMKKKLEKFAPKRDMITTTAKIDRLKGKRNQKRLLDSLGYQEPKPEDENKEDIQEKEIDISSFLNGGDEESSKSSKKPRKRSKKNKSKKDDDDD